MQRTNNCLMKHHPGMKINYKSQTLSKTTSKLTAAIQFAMNHNSQFNWTNRKLIGKMSHRKVLRLAIGSRVRSKSLRLGNSRLRRNRRRCRNNKRWKGRKVYSWMRYWLKWRTVWTMMTSSWLWIMRRRADFHLFRMRRRISMFLKGSFNSSKMTLHHHHLVSRGE